MTQDIAVAFRVLRKKTGASDPSVFIGVTMMLVSIAGLASYLTARPPRRERRPGSRPTLRITSRPFP